MPKQPDRIATEIQGDATIPAGVAEAVSDAYARRETDPSVVQSLKAIVAEGRRELAGEALEPGSSDEPNGSPSRRRGILRRR
jgi:hypothetical protein